MNAVCVFCGSSTGRDPSIGDAAEFVGRRIATRGLGVVYGGAAVGLMGRVADGALAAGGSVVGVLPEFFSTVEIAHPNLSELHIVDSMHARKLLMAQRSDAFLALPGGLGTFEEFCEVVTWTQIGIHDKPCGLLNVGGFFDPLIAQFDRAAEAGFLSPEHRGLVIADDEIDRLLDRLSTWTRPAGPKWAGTMPDELADR